MHRSLCSAVTLTLALLAGCGGGDGGGNGPPADQVVLGKATPSGDAQAATVGTVLPDPLRVLVLRNGAPAADEPVQWTAVNGGIVPAGPTTGADGIASATWTLGNTAGAQTARATLAGATGSPVTFGATAAAGPAAALVKVSGDDQGGRISTAAGAPIIVRVNDQFGNPVAGTDVAFAVTGGSATVVDAVDASGADGLAQTAFNFGATPGAITITATAAALAGSPQTFDAESGQVLVANNQYQPAALVVAVGTTVRWAWATNATTHSVTPMGGAEPANSGVHAAPFAFAHTFNTPGVYEYVCTVHDEMTGTITVQP